MKLDGIDGSGVATLMKDAGLTNGAFYAHFSSKDELVATIVADQLQTQLDAVRAIAVDRAGLEAFVRFYLSPEHRDDRGGGCPSAALLDELARCSDATRAAYTAGLRAMVDRIAAVLEPDDAPSAQARAWNAISLLIGTLQMARALDDPDLSDRVLENGIDSAIGLLGLDQPEGTDALATKRGS